MSDLASTASRFTADSPLPYTRFRKFDLFIFKALHVYVQNQLNPPTWVVIILWAITSFYLLTFPLKLFFTWDSHMETFLRFVGNYLEPSFFLSSFARLIVYFVIYVFLLILPFIFIAITTMFSGTEKQLHRYIGQFTRLIGYILVSPLSLAIVSILSKPLSCYWKPAHKTLVYCTKDTQLPLVIIALITLVIHIVFIFIYHFFVFESNLTKKSLLRARSGRTLAIIMVLTSLWSFFSGILVLYSHQINGYVHIAVSVVMIGIILLFPPYYTPRMNSIILATFLTSMWGGVCIFFIPLTKKFSTAIGSTVFPNILLFLLTFGVPTAFWVCSLIFAPRYFRRNWLVKVDRQTSEVSPKTEKMLQSPLPRQDVIGFSMKIGHDTYVYRKGGYALPSLTRLPSVASYDSNMSKPLAGSVLNSTSSKPPQSLTPTILISPPPLQSHTASAAILPPILPAASPDPPTTPGLIQAPTILLQPSLANLPKPAPSSSPTSTREPESLLQQMRRERNKRLEKVVPQTYQLDEHNLREVIPLITKQVKTPTQFRELLQFLQTPELGTDNFVTRMVDQTFRRLVRKDGYGLQSSFRIDYGMFLMQNMGAQYRMGVQIQKAVELFPDWTDRWLSFVLTKEMEKKQTQPNKTATGSNLEMLRLAKSNKTMTMNTKLTFTTSDEGAINAFTRPSGSGDDSSTTSKMYNIQTQLSQAQKHFTLALNHLQIMWMYLGRRSVDVSKVQTNALKAMAAEKEATHIYIQLLKENPENPNVMRPFARLLRDVSFDDEASNMLIQESDRVEDMNETFMPTVWESDDLEDGMDNDGIVPEPTYQQDKEPQDNKLQTQQTQPTSTAGSTALTVFINQLKANEPKRSRLDNIILPLTIGALVGVLVITIAAYVVTNNLFNRFVVQSSNLRATLFTAMAAEQVAYHLATLAHLAWYIPDPDNLVTDQQIYYDQHIHDYIDVVRADYDLFNEYVQVFYKACDPEWFASTDIPYSIPKNIVGGKLGMRMEEKLQLRQVLYRTQERSMEFADSYEEFFKDVDGFTAAMLESQMNTHLVLTEEVKILGKLTMEKIESIAMTGMITMMALLGVGTIVLFACATFPLGLKIRRTNIRGREKMVKVCSIPIQTAQSMTERLEHSGHTSSTNSTDMESETSNHSKQEVVEDNEEMAVKEEEERSNDAVEKLKRIRGVVPLSITASLITGTALIVLVSYTFFILAFVALMSVPELSRLIILSGYRRIYLNTLLNFIVLRFRPTTFPALDPSDESIIFSTDKYTGVILSNTSFVHHCNPQEDIIRRTATFITHLGSHFTNGLSDDVMTGDEFYDSLKTKGARGRFPAIADLNTRVDDCFLADRTGCDVPERLGKFTGSFNGLLEVLSTIADRAIEVSHDVSRTVLYEDDDMRFLIGLTDQDAQSSLQQIGALLQEELNRIIQSFEIALVAVIAAVSVLEVAFALIFLTPLSSRLRKIDANVIQLDRLSQSGQDKPIVWTDELRTGLVRMDSPKEMMYQSFETLREQVEAKEKKEVVQQTLDQIVLLTISIFDDEEELMRTHEYPSVPFAEHTRQHALLFKRLIDFATDAGKKRPSLEKTKRFISTWIQNHMASVDSDLSMFLRQTLTPSEMNNVPDMNESGIPRSVVKFYRRSNVGMEEKIGVTSVLERVGFDLTQYLEGRDDDEINQWN